MNVEDIPTLRWVVMFVTHAGQDIFNFHSRLIYDEKQSKKVRISWRVLLQGIAEFLRYADKLLENKIFHLDISDNNLRYKFDHAIFYDNRPPSPTCTFAYRLWVARSASVGNQRRLSLATSYLKRVLRFIVL